jgi:hypothetical protein
LEKDYFTPKVASEIRSTTTESNALPILLVTPKCEKLGVDDTRLPIKSYAPLVETLKFSHSQRICHLDICPDNMFAVKDSATGSYFVLLNDWGSSMNCDSIPQTNIFNTHKLFYNVSNMGPHEDLAALVRSVFVLTQNTFPPVDTAEKLDKCMCEQWNWGCALQAASHGNYLEVKLFFESGSVTVNSHKRMTTSNTTNSEVMHITQ